MISIALEDKWWWVLVTYRVNLAASVYACISFSSPLVFLHVGCCCLSTCVRAQRANKSPEKNSRTTIRRRRRKKARLHIGCIYFSRCSHRHQTCLTKENRDSKRVRKRGFRKNSSWPTVLFTNKGKPRLHIRLEPTECLIAKMIQLFCITSEGKRTKEITLAFSRVQ